MQAHHVPDILNRPPPSRNGWPGMVLQVHVADPCRHWNVLPDRPRAMPTLLAASALCRALSGAMLRPGPHVADKVRSTRLGLAGRKRSMRSVNMHEAMAPQPGRCCRGRRRQGNRIRVTGRVLCDCRCGLPSPAQVSRISGTRHPVVNVLQGQDVSGVCA